MSGLFEDIALFDDARAVAQRKAAAVVFKRVDDNVGSFVKRAKDQAEREARLSLVSDDIRQIVADVVEEYGGDAEKLEEAIDEHLRGDGVTELNEELADAPSAVGTKSLSSTKEADAPKDGGGAVKRESLPTGDESALGDPSPKIDKKEWKPNALNEKGNLKPVDAEQEGSPHPTVDQDVDDTPDPNKDFLDQTDAVTDHQTLPTATDSDAETTERNISQEGQGGTWSTNEGQANPVTSSVDPDKNPLRAILESGFATEHQVESAISEFREYNSKGSSVRVATGEVTITVRVEDGQDPVETLQYVAQQISEGYTSGYHPYWTMGGGADAEPSSPTPSV